ncbi:hypothetical protein ACFRAM_15940 [Paenibacillus sp. NPDC056722]|uniref:hypothetical protein n=1 Tax=Paenibacillus sp. NPDC056722 TaxID=3345924 RepID=UPI0036CB1FEA
MNKIKKNIPAILIILGVVLFFLVFSRARTSAIVQLSEISKDSIVVINALGEKTMVRVPSKIDTSTLNEQSYYLVSYSSSFFQRNRFDKIEISH